MVVTVALLLDVSVQNFMLLLRLPNLDLLLIEIFVFRLEHVQLYMCLSRLLHSHHRSTAITSLAELESADYRLRVLNLFQLLGRLLFYNGPYSLRRWADY